jgi:hypothetical protein
MWGGCRHSVQATVDFRSEAGDWRQRAKQCRQRVRSLACRHRWRGPGPSRMDWPECRPANGTRTTGPQVPCRAGLLGRLPAQMDRTCTRKASRFSLRDIVGNRLEGGTVDDLYMSSVPDVQYAQSRKGSKGPAYGRKRSAHIFGNVGAVHRKVYLIHWLASGGLKMLQHLEEQ